MMNKIKFLVLSLTGACNFACRYCYAAEHNKAAMTSATAIQAVQMTVASLAKNERFVIQFSGGEPLLNYATLQAVVEYVEAERLPASLQLQTNASLLTDAMVQYLYQHKVAIGVSLDGRPRVNDSLRLLATGEGATKSILQGMEVLKRNKIACGVTCVVTNENVQELAGIVDFAYYLGNVRKLGFDILRGQGRGAQLVPPSAADMAQAMQEVYAKRDLLTKLTGVRLEIAQEERVCTLANGSWPAFGHCYAMNGEAAFVDSLGDVYACSSLIGEQEYCLGNVLTGRNEGRVSAVKQMINERMQHCRECKDFALCGGGCYARQIGHVEQGAECALKRASIAMFLQNKKRRESVR